MKKGREKKPKRTLYFEKDLNGYLDFCQAMETMADTMIAPCQTPVFLCIGSDRLTGDCLGPFVGHKLQQHYQKKAVIYGTLEHPVHAKNLEYTLKEIKKIYSDPFFIAIDASLGVEKHIGCITLSNGSLFPGEGVRKKLPPVGDIAITGIVGSCLGDATLLLQNTRLHLVNELSDFIFMGIANAFSSHYAF